MRIEEMMKERIEQTLSLLVGLPLTNIYRTLNLEMFDFGEQRTVLTRQGQEKKVGKYALHVQCAWRITNSTRVVVASRDRWYMGDGSKDIPDDFDWSLPGNRCDKRISSFLEANAAEPLVIESIEADHVGGTKLRLTNGFALEIFPDDSFDDEYWRFFQPSTSTEHFVVTGAGIQDRAQ
jgi:hypothetical protein